MEATLKTHYNCILIGTEYKGERISGGGCKIFLNSNNRGGELTGGCEFPDISSAQMVKKLRRLERREYTIFPIFVSLSYFYAKLSSKVSL